MAGLYEADETRKRYWLEVASDFLRRILHEASEDQLRLLCFAPPPFNELCGDTGINTDIITPEWVGNFTWAWRQRMEMRHGVLKYGGKFVSTLNLPGCNRMQLHACWCQASANPRF
jgi:hypothetical protein